MNRTLLIAIATFWAAPATAASYSVGLSAAGPGRTSSTSFAGFNSSLGALTRVDISLSGSTTYDITLLTSPPLSGTATYDVRNGVFLYAQSALGNLTPQPYLQQTAAGTTPISFGDFQVTTSGLNGLTSFTDAPTLAKFLDTSFSGVISVDDPFSSTVTVGGVTRGLSGATIDISSKSISGSVLYTYTARDAAVPEPASWAMMIAGVGLVGGVTRRRARGTKLEARRI